MAIDWFSEMVTDVYADEFALTSNFQVKEERWKREKMLRKPVYKEFFFSECCHVIS